MCSHTLERRRSGSVVQGATKRVATIGTRVVRYFCTLPTKIANPRTRPRSRFQLSIII